MFGQQFLIIIDQYSDDDVSWSGEEFFLFVQLQFTVQSYEMGAIAQGYSKVSDTSHFGLIFRIVIVTRL
jgi:hypothetical protein